MPHRLSLKPHPVMQSEVPVFDLAFQDKKDDDDKQFDSLRADGDLGEDSSLNDGSSAMSGQPSNGPRNRFNDKFGE